MKKALWLLSLLVLTVSLTACGGSSSSSDTTTTSSLSGAVAAAPVKDAKVMVDYKYLTDAAKAAMTIAAPIQVGLTDKDGAIVFDAAAMAKVDRTAEVVLYSKDGVQFTSTEDTVAAAKAASKSADLFNGQLRAVLGVGETVAYLTPANTIVADKMIAGSTYAEAKQYALNLLQNQLGLIGMENPLGNPLADLTKSEFVSQAVLKAFGKSESDLVAGSVSFAGAPAQTAFTAADLTAIVTATKAALAKDGFVVNDDALKTDAAISNKKRTFALELPANASELFLLDSEKTSDFSIKEADLVKAITFTISAKTIAGTTVADDGEYVLKSFEGTGKLQFNGLDAPVGTKFNSALGFTYKPATAEASGVPTEAEMKAFTKVSFTFVAIDAEGNPIANVDPKVVTITKIAPKDLVVTAFTPTFDTKIELDTSAKKIVGGDETSARAAFKVDMTMVNALAKEDLAKALIRYTAPAGYAFTDVENAEDAAAKVTTLDVKFDFSGTKDSFGTTDLQKQAKIIKLGPTAVAYDVKTMTVALVVDEKVVESKTVTVGFVPAAADFEKLRNFTLLASDDTMTEDFVTAPANLTGTIKATFSTLAMEIDAANKKSVTLPNITWKAVAFDENGDAVTGSPINGVPAYMQAGETGEPVIEGAVATVTFNLADKDGNGTAEDAITLQVTKHGDYVVRIAEDSVATEDIAKAGGLAVTSVAPETITLTAEMVKTSPAPTALGSKEVADPAADITFTTGNTYVAKVMTDKVADTTALAQGWSNSAAAEGPVTAATIAAPAVKRIVGGYSLTFTITALKAKEAEANDTIKVKKGAVEIPAFTVELKDDNDSD